jgi:hypothetical protein
MAATLRDFDMPDSAALLEKAKSDIHQKVSDKDTEEHSRN